MVCDVLDALAVRLDGKPASPEYFSRRRRVLHKCLGYAVRKKRLAANPLSKANLPEGWTAPAKPDDTLDPRAVGSPELVATMLNACAHHRQTARPALPALLRLHVLRPDAALRSRRPHPEPAATCPNKAGATSPSPTPAPPPGSAYTDDGAVHEHRGLKGRTKGSRPTARRPARKVPIPPQLVTLLRDHIQAYGTAPDGRLFRSETRHPPAALHLVAGLAESPRRLPHPRAARHTPDETALRPAPLRHHLAARLRRPDAQVAAWAGHSVEMLRRVYAGCAQGLEGIWITRMDQTLPRDES